MHLPARSRFASEKKHYHLISNKAKLFIFCIIFFISCLSGKVPSAKNINHEEPVIQTAESVYSPTKYTTGNSNEARQTQIRQIKIGQKSIPSPTAAPTSAPKGPDANVWGVATKIDTHTYTMQVQPDNTMATAGEIFAALNNYRQQHGSGRLTWDDGLAGFANSRTGYFNSISKLDNHDGFFDYLNNQDGFKKLGFRKVGENSSIGFTLQSVHLIEWVYAGDEEHNGNQLNNEWQYAGIGVTGNATDIIFAANKM